MMRYTLRVCLGLVFCCFLFAQDGTEEDPWIVYNSLTVRAVWDAPTDPTVVRTEVVFYRTSGEQDNPADHIALISVDQPDNEAPIRVFFEGVADGVYFMRARHFDEADNMSDWSAEMFVEKDWTVPMPPGNLRIVR